MKEQGQNTPDLKNEEEIGSLPEKEFRIMIVKMIHNLGNRIDIERLTLSKSRKYEILSTNSGREREGYKKISPILCQGMSSALSVHI